MSDKTLTWLHLSDLHRCPNRDGGAGDIVLERLKDDLKTLHHSLRPDLIFMTGDLAFGQLLDLPLGEQLLEVWMWLEGIRQLYAPEVPSKDVFLVPGNHDIDRTRVNDKEQNWLKTNDKGRIHKLLHEAGDEWRHYMVRLAAFESFIGEKYPHIADGDGRCIYHAIREVAGLQVGVAGFNSAWSCGKGGDDKGQLWLGEWQVDELVWKLMGADVRIALVHHPFNWLVGPEDSTLKTRVQSEFHILLHGHEHHLWVETPQDRHLRIAAGAVHGRPDASFGYNIVRFDLKEQTGEVWLRGLDHDTKKWMAKVVPGQTDEHGVWRVPLPWEMEKASLESDVLGLVGARFQVEHPLGSRDQEDLFLAATSETPSTRVTLRVLKPDVPSGSRVWFRQRHRCWTSIDHPDIARVLPASDPDSADPRPYIASENLEEWTSLAARLRYAEALDRETVIEVFGAVVEVCEAANAAGVRLQAISIEDVLIRGGRVKVVGFDTASPADGGEIRGLQSWSHVSPEWKRMAPELREEPTHLAETVDVFALGVLLERMQGRIDRPQIELRGEGRRDPLRCLAFHCLARDCRLRCQSIRQVRLLLADRVEAAAALLPPVVDVGAEHVPDGRRVRVAKYLTTNVDYELFCRDMGRKLPGYPEKPDMLKSRLSGPWLPVSYVNLADANEYCQWLSRRTSMTWRLPTEAEWRLAATLRERRGRVHRDESTYPWGPEPPCDSDPRASFRGNWGCLFGGPTVVGSFWDGRDPLECLDLAGNVWEWTSDRESPLCIVKGGAYDHEVDSMKISSQNAVPSSTRVPHIGFRVVTGGEQ